MYIYANNNPIIYIDPMGHAIFIGLVIGIVAVGSTAIANVVNNKKQIKKAAKEINKVQKKYNDLNTKLSDAVKSNTKKMNPVQKLDYFVENVKTGGNFDLKNTEEWKNTNIYYEGLLIEPQDIGNYHFGYIERAMGYNIDFLTTGAGIYQIKSGTSKLGWCFSTSSCDDPRDTYYIKLGAIAYDRDN